MSLQTASKDSITSINYSVIRWKQDIFKESSVGIIMVSKMQPKQQNIVYGTDCTYFNSHFRGDKNISFDGAVSQNYTSNKEKKYGLASR